MFGKTKAERLADILGTVPDSTEAPGSVVRKLRGGQSQTEVALKSAVSQGHLSLVESGDKPLTADVARKLAPHLGVTPQRLQTMDQVGRLREAALKGSVDPASLLMTIQDLSLDLPDDEVSDRLIDALLAVLKDALEHHDRHQAAVSKAALKSAPTGPDSGTRDSLGRRRKKPHARID